MKRNRCDDVRDLLAAPIDGTATTVDAESLDAHLAVCAPCREALERLAATVNWLHSLPPREPVLDLWRELQPALADARREMRLGPIGRLRLLLARIRSQAAAGAIVFTGQVARNTDSALRRWMLQDPFLIGDEA
ncbi:MAG: zf-HC2 domain-containing protein [Armatimonadota bacterium]